MITLDTSALFVVFSADDQDHARVRSALLGDRGPYLVPAATLGEIAYLLERELPPATVDAFVDDLDGGGFTLDCGDQDLPRVRALLAATPISASSAPATSETAGVSRPLPTGAASLHAAKGLTLARIGLS